MTSRFGRNFGAGEFHFQFGHDRITLSVRNIILANTIIFAVILVGDIALAFAGESATRLALLYLGFSKDGLLSGFVWTPFTYMFLHSGLYHLFFNMLMLYFFGPDVERVLGTRQFVRFYLFCGIVAVLLNLALAPSALVIGASGACLAVLMAFALIDPERQVFLFSLPFPINARALVIIIIVLNIINALNPDSMTSVWTHFGGLGAGFVYMKLIPRWNEWRGGLRRRRGPPRKKLDELGKEIDNIFKFQDHDRK